MSDKNYIYIPWIRQGVSNLISIQDELGATPTTPQNARVELTASVQLNGVSVSPKDKDGNTLNVSLVGPGDIKSISEDAILNIEPKPLSRDFESNYFPFIEFYEEDFPWRFTPLSPNASNNKKLRPWLALIVLSEDEYVFVPSKEGLPYVTIESGVDFQHIFHKAEDHYAWAHVQYNPIVDPSTGGYTNEQILSDIKSDPDSAFSRIMCPRRLDPDTKYEAFLIPTFEIGRLGGLGRDFSTVDIQTPAWDVSLGTGATERDFPVYKHWEFSTDKSGDFENMVKNLEPIELENSKGGRPMDIQNTGVNISTSFSTEVKLEGALQPLDYTSMPWPSISEDDSSVSDTDYISDLLDVVNIDFEYNNTGTVDDPIVSPPKYGQWLRRQKQVISTSTSQKWFKDININPAYRSVAALGTKVVQRNQENYMERAWNQIGEVEAANQRIRQAELAKWVGESILRRNIKTDSDSRFLGKSSPLLTKIKEGTDTILTAVDGSNLPKATLDAGFRKLTRSRSHVIRRSSGGSSSVPSTYAETIMNFDGIAANRNSTADRDLHIETAFIDNTPSTTISAIASVSPDFVSFVASNASDIVSGVTPPESTYNLTETSATYGYTSEPIDLFKTAIEERVNPMLATSSHAKKLSTKIRTINASGTAVSYIYEKPIMAHPEFKDNMYEALRELDTQYLIPNLDSFPNNSVTLLQTNPKFIESYFVGLNHEMSRELLWREYPTDQRGTYFKHFWDKSEADVNSPDVNQMHLWNSNLGSNMEVPPGADPSASQVVLFIRGDVLRKFPDTVIYAQKAGAPILKDPIPTTGSKVDKDKPKPFDIGDGSSNYKKMPIFRMDIQPDITVLGFDLDPDEVRSNIDDDGNGQTGWYFVFAERPGKPRFGLDIDSTGETLASWQDLSWEDVLLTDPQTQVDLSAVSLSIDPPNTLVWGESSADMASITYQKPAMIAIHADRMTLEPEE